MVSVMTASKHENAPPSTREDGAVARPEGLERSCGQPLPNLGPQLERSGARWLAGDAQSPFS